MPKAAAAGTAPAPAPDHRLHARRNGIGKRHVKRHGKRDVAEEGHVWELIKSYRIPK